MVAPQELQRHADAAELGMHPFEIDGGARRRLTATDELK